MSIKTGSAPVFYQPYIYRMILNKSQSTIFKAIHKTSVIQTRQGDVCQAQISYVYIHALRSTDHCHGNLSCEWQHVSRGYHTTVDATIFIHQRVHNLAWAANSLQEISFQTTFSETLKKWKFTTMKMWACFTHFF